MATTDELLKKNTEVTTPSTGAAETSAPSNTDRINAVYDAQRNQQQTQLKDSYEQSMSAYDAAQQKIAPQYQQSANDLATQYERDRLNFARRAAATGINTGTAAQESLARGSQYQRDFGALRTAEANAQAEAERRKAELTAQYQRDVAAALADNDYNRALALFNESQNAAERDLQKAQILADYGDFSGFAAIYGQPQADSMAALWNAQNPDLAYNTGRMDAEQYKAMTGQYPAGYTPAGGIGYGGINHFQNGGWDPGNTMPINREWYDYITNTNYYGTQTTGNGNGLAG